MAIFAAGLAAAAPVRWTLSGVTLSDGGTATGSFIFDASTGSYSSVSITTSGGTVTGQTYIAPVSGQAFATYAVFVPTNTTPVPDGTPYFFLSFSSALTGAGGTISLVPGGAQSEGTCSSNCSQPTAQLRNITAGSITGATVSTGVPALSSWGIGSLAMLLAAAAVMLSRRLDQRAAETLSTRTSERW